MVGLSRLELLTSRLSGVRSNQLSYRPMIIVKQILSALALRSRLSKFEKFGGDEENRTPDPLLARPVLSQLSYTPKFNGGPKWTRTTDLTLIRRAL